MTPARPRVRLKYACVGGGAYGLNIAASEYVNRGVRLLRTSDLAGGRLAPEDQAIFVPPEAVAAEDLLEMNDLLLSRSGTIGRAFLVPAEAAGMAYAGFLVRYRTGPDVSPRFAYYCTQSAEFQSSVQAEAIASTIQNFNAERYNKLAVPLPPPEEQRSINAYLDRETARIDILIEEQQRLIELLRERRRAAISTAVARGLDQSVVLTESGLPGAGRVPAHWEVLPLRHTISFQEGPGIMAADFRDEGVPLLRVSSVRTPQSTLEGCNYLDPVDVARRWSHFRVDLGDLLISASASMGTVSEVTEETVGAVPYTGIIRIKPGRMLKEFVRWFAVSGEFMDQVDSLKTGSTIQHFGPTHLAQMRVAIPPAGEQRHIAAYLDEETARIDALTTESERFIELVRERRSALITTAVTGEIDVRGVG